MEDISAASNFRSGLVARIKSSVHRFEELMGDLGH